MSKLENQAELNEKFKQMEIASATRSAYGNGERNGMLQMWRAIKDNDFEYIVNTKLFTDDELRIIKSVMDLLHLKKDV